VCSVVRCVQAAKNGTGCGMWKEVGGMWWEVVAREVCSGVGRVGVVKGSVVQCVLVVLRQCAPYKNGSVVPGISHKRLLPARFPTTRSRNACELRCACAVLCTCSQKGEGGVWPSKWGSRRQSV